MTDAELLIAHLDARDAPTCCPDRRATVRVRDISVDLGCSSCGRKLFETSPEHLECLRLIDEMTRNSGRSVRDALRLRKGRSVECDK